VFFRRSTSQLPDVASQLEQLQRALGKAFDDFDRELGRQPQHSRRRARQPRAGIDPARLPSPPWSRPLSRPSSLPKRLRTPEPPTVLERRRRRHGRPQFAIDAEAGAQRLADRLRARLVGLRRSLRTLRERLMFWRPRRQPGTMPSRRIPITTGSADDAGDRVLPALILIATALLGWDLLGARKAPVASEPPVSIRPVAVSAELEARVREMAQAIATAEGYYAPGPHDGRTLPYVLNNPGGLKKPALAAANLPTWKDTGLVQFPSADMGWEALHHQVRLMLTGASGIYDTSDSLLHVGEKYANGDVNWGVNVATTLGVPAAITLSELTPRD
jgi:hypothetical protein